MCFVQGKAFYYQMFGPSLKKKVIASIQQITDQYKNYVLIPKTIYDISVTGILNGKYDIMVHIPMTQGHQALDLFRIQPVPMVYQNRIMIKLTTKLRVIGTTSDASKVVFFENLEDLRTNSHKYYQSRESFELLDFEDNIEKSCEIAFLTKSLDLIRKLCTFEFLEPHTFTLRYFTSKENGETEMLTYTTESTFLRMICGVGDPEDAKLDLEEGLHIVKIPDPSCTLLLGFDLEEYHKFIVESEEFSFHQFSQRDFETIWPELKQKQFRFNDTIADQKDEL